MVHAHITADAIYASTRNIPSVIKSEIGSQPTMCQVYTGAYVSLLGLEKPTIPLATQEKLPRQTQVNWKKKKKKREDTAVLVWRTEYFVLVFCFPSAISAVEQQQHGSTGPVPNTKSMSTEKGLMPFTEKLRNSDAVVPNQMLLYYRTRALGKGPRIWPRK